MKYNIIMSLNKFTDINTGLNLKLNAGFQNLAVSDNAEILGNIIPSSSSAPGSVLSNSDGKGALQWIGQPQITQGLYIPNYSVNSGSVLQTRTSPWQKINNIVYVSGWLEIKTPAGVPITVINVPMPSGLTSLENNNFSAVCTGGAGGGISVNNYTASLLDNVGTGVLILYLQRADGSNFNNNQNIINWTLQFSASS